MKHQARSVAGTCAGEVKDVQLDMGVMFRLGQEPI